jgi:flagellar FliJ protein
MFRFRLEALLRVRRRREEAAAIELARAQAAARNQAAVVAGLEGERKRHQAALVRLECQGLLARDLLLHRDYERALGRRLERARLHLGELEAACEEQRRKLLERTREKKMLEKLESRQRRLARLAEGRAEQKTLDELSLRSSASSRGGL